MSEPTNREVIVLNTALELGPAERAAYLDRACDGNAALRKQVEALLQAHDQAEGFLDAPPAGLDFQRAGNVNLPVTEKPGDKIGRYKLLQQIGEGGCGVVYMAEQEEPVRRRVAVKVIKLGMDTKQVIARFEAERQALAMMDHPNIAKVLDAGATETGRPYFVMELVRGVKITEFCDENNLSTEGRLKLFIQVCEAIQHAHQKGIIHRDIKPSNILITLDQPGGTGAPKVIDFGIAKATHGRLTDKTVFTAFDQFMGTPAYMSPEQAVMTNLDIDTRSDIYSLGVLLYELLTGSTPFEQKELLEAGLNEMRRTILEKEPPKPSTRFNALLEEARTTAAKHRQTESAQLAHVLRGDLDWIAMKCLEKDRARRYETANGLASDIQRHLSTEPIVARPPSSLYRLQKAIRRNKAVFVGAAAVLIVLIAGVIVSTMAAFRTMRAEREQIRLRQVAETKQRKSEQVARFLEDMLQAVGPSVAVGRDTALLRDILARTAEHVGHDLKDQPEVEGELRSIIGNTYFAIANDSAAESMHRQAVAIYTKLYGSNSLYVASALDRLSADLSSLGKQDDAEAMQRDVLAMRKKLLGSEHIEVARSQGSLAIVLLRQTHAAPEAVSRRKLAEAESLQREALMTHRKLRSDPLTLARALANLGLILQGQGSLQEAEKALREALGLEQDVLGKEHPGAIGFCSPLAEVLMNEGKYAESETLYREALATSRRICGNEHPQVAYFLGHLAMLLQKMGNLAESETMRREAVTIYAKAKSSDQPHPYLAGTLNDLAELVRSEGRLSESEELFREAVAVGSKMPGKPSAGSSLNGLLDVLLKEEKLSEADKLIGQMLNETPNDKSERSRLLRARGDLRAGDRHWDEAATDFLQALEMKPDDKELCLSLAVALLKAERYSEYRRHCHEALARPGGERAAKAALLLPVDGPDLERACQQTSAASEPVAPRWRAWVQLSRALAEVRQGHYELATNLTDRVLSTAEADLPFQAQASFVRASACAHLERIEAAKAALANGNEMMTRSRAGLTGELATGWREWAVAELLLEQANALIAAPVPGVRK